MKSFIITALAAVFVLGVAGNAQPAGGRGPGRGFGPGPGQDLKETLKLDDATAAKIEKLRDEFRKERIALRAKLETARVEFHSAMRKEEPDEKAALAKQKEMSGIRERIRSSALEHRFAVSRLLTPEQRAALRERGGRGGGFPGDGGNGCDCRDGCDEGGRRMRDGRGARAPRHHRSEGMHRRGDL